MTMNVTTQRIFRLGKYRLRVWRYGFEIGNNFGGRVFFWPWTKQFWRAAANETTGGGE